MEWLKSNVVTMKLCKKDIDQYAFNSGKAMVWLGKNNGTDMSQSTYNWAGIKTKVIDWLLSLFNHRIYFPLNNIGKQKASILSSRLQDYFVVKMPCL